MDDARKTFFPQGFSTPMGEEKVAYNIDQDALYQVAALEECGSKKKINARKAAWAAEQQEAPTSVLGDKTFAIEAAAPRHPGGTTLLQARACPARPSTQPPQTSSSLDRNEPPIPPSPAHAPPPPPQGFHAHRHPAFQGSD